MYAINLQFYCRVSNDELSDCSVSLCVVHCFTSRYGLIIVTV